MSASDQPVLTSIYRYPVKGLSPQTLDTVALVAGATIPFDRAYAIENGPGRFNPEAPRHLPKINFLMLMRNARLAGLETEFDEATRTLTIHRAGGQVARGALDTKLGRQMIEQFLAGYMASDLRGPPHIVHADGHSFSDVAEKCLHVINLASIRDLERSLGRDIDPLRFRANLYIDGVPPWSEFQWVDKEISVGEARLHVYARTDRCEATNVDPKSGARDMAIPASLTRQLGDADFGVYATVVSDGVVRTGDRILAADASSG
ncbi:MAG: MOSC domain-containing protein [Methyloligellaceae bacterium]